MAKSYTFQSLGLMDDTPDEAILNITKLAAHILKSPVALTSLLEENKNRQFFAASVGLSEDLAASRQTPINQSICQFVKLAKRTILIADMRVDDRTKDNKLVRDENFISYIGSPIHNASGQVVGALCCMKNEPYTWAEGQIETLEMLAKCIDEIIHARTASLEEQKSKNELNKLLVSRSGYVAHLSHEIRTPLTSIIGSVKLLKTVPLNGKAERLVEFLDRSSERLMAFISDADFIGKLDADNYISVQETCDIAAVISSIADGFQGLAKIKSVQMSVTNQLVTSIYHFDRYAVEMIVKNLISNALKYTESGSVKIRLRDGLLEEVIIDVIDTGVGISPEYHEKIFQEFEQSDHNSPRTNGGTGLGMTIVKRMVDGLDGDISLLSHLGEGAKFSVTLPLKSVDT
ncbi:GAF domain-containing sensor histidine kinase [Loktanella sp. DJP18]|uniref:GAF domain-containing sensor histidine kinase n=1 Tax=Loktanella sp. DJP18 TaxID=3409788 RepID=UPI003BB62FAE